MNWETILGVITHPVTVMIMSSVAGIALAGFKKYKKAFNELVDIPRVVLKARKAKSPGGRAITEAEYAEIGKEIVEFLEAGGKLYDNIRKK